MKTTAILFLLGVSACQRSTALPDARESMAPPDAGRWPPAPASAASVPVSTVDSAATASPLPSTKLVQEGTYWPFARLPPRIGDIGQGAATVFAGVPGGGCSHWNCSVHFSLVAGCAVSLEADQTCVFGQLFWQTVFGDEDPLAGPAVLLHRGVHGHLHRGDSYLGGLSIAWPAIGNSVNELTLQSGREAYLITLANALIDAQF